MARLDFMQNPTQKKHKNQHKKRSKKRSKARFFACIANKELDSSDLA